MDRWSEQSVWDAVLSGLHVVVSTYVILSDALGHGFIRMRDLALIIFDEGKMVFLKRDFSDLVASLHLCNKPMVSPLLIERTLFTRYICRLAVTKVGSYTDRLFKNSVIRSREGESEAVGHATKGKRRWCVS